MIEGGPIIGQIVFLALFLAGAGLLAWAIAKLFGRGDQGS